MDSAPNAGVPARTDPATAEEQLENALDFLGHDARAGHSSTLALLALARLRTDPPEWPALLDRIESNAVHALNTIDDFADQIRARRQALRLDAFEWTDLLVDVVADAWVDAQQKGVRIRITPESASVVGRGDRKLLAAALAKLVRDAVSAAKTASEIQCRVSVEGSDGVFEIVEERVPSTPDEPTSTTRKVDSGLLFARGVAERHGGTIAQRIDRQRRHTRLSVPLGDVPESSAT
jgi:signal transduction histidine kinase